MHRPPPTPTLFPYTTLFRSVRGHSNVQGDRTVGITERPTETFLDRLGAEFGFEPPRNHGFDTVKAIHAMHDGQDRKSTRLNSSHGYISYAVFCLKKKKQNTT